MKKLLSFGIGLFILLPVIAEENKHPDIYDDAPVYLEETGTHVSKQNKAMSHPKSAESPVSLVYDYIEAINRADMDKLCELMAEDHLFIDAHDNQVKGIEGMKQSWAGYFEMFPDYKIEVNEVIEKGSTICVLGYAGGTYKNRKNQQNSNYWRVPAAWTVIVENNRIKHWQVYADNYFAIEIISRNEK